MHAGSPEALYPPAQPGHGLLPSHPELNIHGQAAQQYQYITGVKRDREDGQPDYHHPNAALQVLTAVQYLRQSILGPTGPDLEAVTWASSVLKEGNLGWTHGQI